jgi:hypothetical protein
LDSILERRVCRVKGGGYENSKEIEDDPLRMIVRYF